MPLIGVIGGSGLYGIPGLEEVGRKAVKTPFGDPSDSYLIAEFSGGVQAVFLPRHGAGHAVAPHKINYRANIWGMKELGVERIIAVNATGGIDSAFAPGSIVIPDQILDFTGGGRPATFYEEKDVVHVDFTEPYCPELRASLLGAAKKAGVPAAGKGTYVCTNGPRLESRAEVAFYAKAGGHVVGMTGMPEAILARELELCYSAIAVVTNFAAGVSDAKKLTTTEVIEYMGKSAEAIRQILKEVFPLIPGRRGCPCKDALKDSRL
ncbi:MAG: S-methyl-5'-thioadenosine phosphorylase [Nitrospiraceae bacterium]|nr:S-methyl-5'-thioadenosine phosphorylase [Nitrospiraceae bacterium]